MPTPTACRTLGKKARSDPGNPRDGTADANGNGYTNLEEYQNATNPR